jgi:hypothetical protein
MHYMQQSHFVVTRWPDPEVIQAWGMHEDFQAFATTTGLLEFSRHPQKTYKEISHEFIATFWFEHIKIYKETKRGKEVTPTFTINFSMMNQCRGILETVAMGWLNGGARRCATTGPA